MVIFLCLNEVRELVKCSKLAAHMRLPADTTGAARSDNCLLRYKVVLRLSGGIAGQHANFTRYLCKAMHARLRHKHRTVASHSVDSFGNTLHIAPSKRLHCPHILVGDRILLLIFFVAEMEMWFGDLQSPLLFTPLCSCVFSSFCLLSVSPLSVQ